MSAETTHTSVTPGKSWPLATICVPTSTSISPPAKRERDRYRSAVVAASRSSRATRAAGKRSATSASMRSVPAPTASSGPPHAGQRSGTGPARAAVVAQEVPGPRWKVSATSQRLQGTP